MEEPLITAGVLGYFRFGQHIMKLYGYRCCVYHYVFGVAGMYSYAVNSKYSGSGVEVLVFYLPYGAAVYGIAIVAAQSLYVDAVSATTNFLIGGEYSLYFAVGPAACDKPIDG